MGPIGTLAAHVWHVSKWESVATVPRTCTICNHPQRAAIDQALVSGGSLRDIAGRFGVAKSSLERHRMDHLPQAIVKAAEQQDIRHAIDIIKQLQIINGVSLNILIDARNTGNPVLALKAIDRVQRQIELQAKLLGDLDDRPQINQVNLLLAPEWLMLRTVLMEALSPYPEAKIAVAHSLARLVSSEKQA